MALYIYTPDNAEGASNCYDACASAWPPLEFTGSTNDTPTGTSLINDELSVIERTDGIYQVAYFGWPLYTYAYDSSVGDTNG